MPESKSGALPLGDIPSFEMRPVLDTRSIIARQMGKCNRKFCAPAVYFLTARAAKTTLTAAPFLQHMRKGRLFVFAAALAATVATALLCGAVAAIRAANTFFAAFLCFIHVPCGKADDRGNYSDNDKIDHKIYFLPLRAYSALTLLSALTQR